ncbi:hypothetical protein ABV409_14660 [Flagellimonas sp. DF-77]|uniref:hypothetical protein n=1 Tax=Flagellimonas algarum TaxID=3230298 RepID=UPI0033930E80
METVLLFLSPLIGIALWMLSLHLLRRWKHFWAYFGCNCLALVGYTAYILLGGPLFIGDDPYSLGRLFLLVAFPIVHALLGTMIAIVINWKLRRAQRA